MFSSVSFIVSRRSRSNVSLYRKATPLLFRLECAIHLYRFALKCLSTVQNLVPSLISHRKIISVPNLLTAIIFFCMFFTDEELRLLQFCEETEILILIFSEKAAVAAAATCSERSLPTLREVHGGAVAYRTKVKGGFGDRDGLKVICPFTLSLTFPAWK